MGFRGQLSKTVVTSLRPLQPRRILVRFTVAGMIPSYGVGFTSEQFPAGHLCNTNASVALSNANATIALMNLYHAKVVFFKFVHFFCMWLFYLLVCLCTMWTRRGYCIKIVVTDAYEPPCACWDLNSGTLEEQLVLLASEPSL